MGQRHNFERYTPSPGENETTQHESYFIPGVGNFSLEYSDIPLPDNEGDRALTIFVDFDLDKIRIVDKYGGDVRVRE